MQVTVEELSPLSRKLKITVAREDVAEKMESAYRKLNSQVSLKGFRKGKVPKNILVKTYGPRIEEEVSEEMIKETYFDALEETKLDVVVHPEITSKKFAEDGTFLYEAEVDVRPLFELGEYKGLEIERPEVKVEESEVEERLEVMRKEMAPLRSVEDRAVWQNDLVVIDFNAYHNGELMKQAAGVDYSVDVGSGRNGKEFEDALLGLIKGEETLKEIEFPAQFANPVLAGKKIEFKIKVKDIKERVLPPLDDEFAKDAGENFNSLEELKANVAREIKARKEKDLDGELTDKIMARLLDENNFEVPKRLVTYEVNELIKEMEERLKAQGITLEAAGMDRSALVEQYKEAAERRVRGDFLLKKIAEQEDIKVTEEDMQNGFQRIADQYRLPLAEVKKYFSKRDDLLPFMNELLNENILKFLRNEAKITIIPAPGENSAGQGAEG